MLVYAFCSNFAYATAGTKKCSVKSALFGQGFVAVSLGCDAAQNFLTDPFRKALTFGGADAPSNMQCQTVEVVNAKDKLKRQGERKMMARMI